jgi:uncharacterized membrane protein
MAFENYRDGVYAVLVQIFFFIWNLIIPTFLILFLAYIVIGGLGLCIYKLYTGRWPDELEERASSSLDSPC